MSKNYQDWQSWILQNLLYLTRLYGKNNVLLDTKTWQSILIRHYYLPPTWKQDTSPLLIVLPEKAQIFYSAPDRFYLKKGLRAINGKKPGHYYENKGFNDLHNLDYARFSFHLEKGWDPKIDCKCGTNLIHVIGGLYKGLDLAAREVM